MDTGLEGAKRRAGGDQSGDSHLNAGTVTCSRPVLGMRNGDIVEEVALVSGWKKGGKGRGESGLGSGFEPRC